MLTDQPSLFRTGRLEPIGRHRLGLESYDYTRCADCGGEYPDGMCNGKAINGLCPFCRPDTAPWTNGRGL